MKFCKYCKKHKELSSFNKDLRFKDLVNPKCKLCRKYKVKINRPIIDNGKYICKGCSVSKELIEYTKDNSKLNKISDFCKSCQKLKRLSNKDYQKRYFNNRRKVDFKFKLTSNLRTLIKNYTLRLLNGGYINKYKTNNIIGCSFDDFKKHIESQFLNWMSWDNYGRYNGELNCGWDLDHIVPISSAKTEEDVYKLNHWSNFQPLCSKINRDIKIDNSPNVCNLILK